MGAGVGIGVGAGVGFGVGVGVGAGVGIGVGEGVGFGVGDVVVCAVTTLRPARARSGMAKILILSQGEEEGMWLGM